MTDKRFWKAFLADCFGALLFISAFTILLALSGEEFVSWVASMLSDQPQANG